MADNLLLVAGDDSIRRDVVAMLQGGGFRVGLTANADEAGRALAAQPPDLILLESPWPPDLTQGQLEEWIRDYPILMICHESGVAGALRALRLGAAEFLLLPLNAVELIHAVRRVIDHALLYRSGDFYTSVLRHEAPSLLVGDSPPLRRLLDSLKAVGPSEATVLILGESGVGKEKVAQEIHRLSTRAEGPLVAVDCSSLPETLFESELFGHERGAFTGATHRKPGLIEQARGGTLFLDEIGEIPATIQAKLLRVLETRRFRRLGSAADLEADVRILAATNRDLEDMAARGEFRRDLLFRLNAFVVAVPPLRERREDIPALTRYFLTGSGLSRGVGKRVSEPALHQLMGYDWPGNVRELRNVIERAVILSGNKLRIDSEHLVLKQTGPSSPAAVVTLAFDHEPTLAEIEQAYLGQLLERHEGRRAEVARVMGIGERTLYRMLAARKEGPGRPTD